MSLVSAAEKMSGKEEIILGILVVLAIVPLVVAFFKWIWNITMPEVFDFKEITFWQAFRLLIIAGFLFQATSGS